MRESRSRFSPGSRGRGSDLERGLCPAHPGAPPLPRPPDRLPHSFSPTGVSPAPPSGLLFGGLRFRLPKPWGPSMLVLDPGPSRALSFSPALGAPISLLGSSAWGRLHSQFPPIPDPPPFPLPHLSVYLLSTLPEPLLNTIYQNCICWRPPHCYIVLFPLFLILIVSSLRSRGVRRRGT